MSTKWIFSATKVAVCLLCITFSLATNVASAYTYKGSSSKPQGRFFDKSGQPLTVSQWWSNTLSFKGGSVATIGSYAFHNCASMTELELPSTVTKIGYFAFSNCTKLTKPIFNSYIYARHPVSSASVDIAENTRVIASAAFRNCNKLTEVTLPSSIETIGESAFAGCTSMTIVKIPAKTTSIGDFAFKDCGKLKCIYVGNPTPLTLASGVFDGVDKKNCALVVPVGSASSYKSKWGFSVVVELQSENSNAVATAAPVLKLSGSFTKETFPIINEVVKSSDALVVDLKAVTAVNGKFTPENNNILYLTAKEAKDLNMENTANVVVNGVCKELIVNDGKPFGADKTFTATKATYERVMSTTWGTVCLPFEVKSSSSVQFYTKGTVKDGVLTLYEAATVPAGQPAIFKRTSADKLSLTGDKVSVVTNTIDPAAPKDANIQLYGTYSALELEQEDLYYIAKDKFWLKTPGSPLIVNPFRAWFEIQSASHSSLRIEEGVEEVNSLETINAMIEDTATYYDENGHQLKEMKKGMNIVRLPDGSTRKVILR